MITARTRYGRRLDAIPTLAAFCDRADALVRAGDPDSFWDAAPAFHDLLGSDVLEAFVAYELAAIAEREMHFILGSSDYHAPLAETPAYSLVVKVLPPEAADLGAVGTLTEHTLLAIWQGQADVETLTLPSRHRIDVFDRAARLDSGERTTLVPGRVVAFHAPHETFRLRLTCPTVILQLQSETIAPLRWVFNPQTLEPVRATASSLRSSRLEFTCRTLAALGSPSSLAPLERLTTHPEHYVRWAAVQAICAIDRDAGLACLARTLVDDHPHVRRAAAATLAAC